MDTVQAEIICLSVKINSAINIQIGALIIHIVGDTEFA